VLSSQQADSLGSIAASLGGILWSVGVGEHLELASRINPGHQDGKFSVVLDGWGSQRLRAQEHLARLAVDADPVALLERHHLAALVAEGDGRGVHVDVESRAAAHAGLPPAAGDHRGMRGESAR